MKYIIRCLFLLLFVVFQGCASLGDNGDITETATVMPDGSKHVFWERTKVNLWVPSTHMIKSYSEVCLPPLVPGHMPSPAHRNCKMAEYGRPHLLAQDGPGTHVLTELIRAGSLVGSTVYAADKALQGAQAIGSGLSQSGNTTEVNTTVKGTSNSVSRSKAGSLSFSNAKVTSKQYQGQYQRQHQGREQREYPR